MLTFSLSLTSFKVINTCTLIVNPLNILTLTLLIPDISSVEHCVNPDQMASYEAI